MELKRTHNCGELRKKDIGKDVILNGWVQNRRDHGGLIFIDLRDRFGLTQVVFDPKHDKESHSVAETLRREDVIAAKGRVRARGEGLENPKLDTGQIEVITAGIEMIGKANTPPLEVEDRIVANDEMRLRYRYLDLRRPVMQSNLLMRHKTITAARQHFNDNGFIEIDTPILVRSTPEGARDYIVPSRVNPGSFYALPQSPQLYKQILMISGVDRYYQVAKCLRDEDLRADRQPEHTQFDFEMSFVDSDDIMGFVESLFSHIFKTVLGAKLDRFPRIAYDEAMARYGTDKPDIRYGLELTDVTDIVKDCGFQVFKDVVEKGGTVKCINPEKDLGRKEIDSLIDFSIKSGAKGMAWMRVTKDGLESNIVKFFSDDIQKKLLEETGAKPGSILMFIADKPAVANNVLNLLRQELAKKLDLVDDKVFRFCWVTDFPLFAWDDDTGSWTPEHHMFSMPKKEHLEFLDKDPGKVKGDLFDLVLNGIEMGSGSIRIHDPAVQKKVMKVIGLDEKDAEKKFGFLIEAYKYGAPVHGGMGLGVDRLVALMTGTNDIREVIAFPKNKAAQCPMDSSPGPVGNDQLKELHLKLDIVRKKQE